MKNLSKTRDYANFEKKCLNNDAFRAVFVVNPVKTIQNPSYGLGIRLSETAIEELNLLISDYLGAANMIVVEDPDAYNTLKEEVREQCPDVPMGAI